MTYLSRIETNSALLDRPIWGSLSTCLAPISERMGTARALPRQFGPLAAAASPDEFRDFMLLISQRKEPLLTFEANTPLDQRLCVPEDQVGGVQMIGHLPEKPKYSFKVTELRDTHAKQILALAKCTRPGPFASQTHLLGDFIGIFEGSELIAMAGQRLRIPGFTEISAVCVDQSYRGRGIGAELVRQMSKRILDSGHVPFLHAYESNAAAISLYEGLGFKQRARLQVISWVKNAAVQYG